MIEHVIPRWMLWLVVAAIVLMLLGVVGAIVWWFRRGA